MAAKASLIICATALLVQTAYSACFGGLAAPLRVPAPALAYDGLAPGYGCGCSGVASTGGGLPIASASPYAPVGVSVLSENIYEGTLAAGGNLPFLGTVGVEGVLPTAGVGAVSYGCGDGAIGIATEGPIATGIAAANAVFPPGTPSTVATADALAMAGSGFGLNGYRTGYTGYGFGKGFGLNRGCGCGTIF